MAPFIVLPWRLTQHHILITQFTFTSHFTEKQPKWIKSTHCLYKLAMCRTVVIRSVWSNTSPYPRQCKPSCYVTKSQDDSAFTKSNGHFRGQSKQNCDSSQSAQSKNEQPFCTYWIHWLNSHSGLAIKTAPRWTLSFTINTTSNTSAYLSQTWLSWRSRTQSSEWLCSTLVSVDSCDDIRPLATLGFNDANIRLRWPSLVMSSNCNDKIVDGHMNQ